MNVFFHEKQLGCHIVQISRDDAMFSGDVGAELVRRQVEYGRELEKQRPGSRLSLIVLTLNPSAERFEVENVSFIPSSGGKFLRRLRILSCLKTLHEEQPIDVITTQTIFDEAWLALAFAWLNGARVVGQIHYDIFSKHAQTEMLSSGLLGQIRFAFGKRCLRYFFALRVVGKQIKERLLAENLHRKVDVIPVPVTMLNTQVLTAFTKESETPRVLYVGRLASQKNLSEWLEVAAIVAAKNEDVEFDIVGDGFLRDELEQKAAKLGILSRVHFHGYVVYDELIPFYQKARVFLLTSHYEGFGRVLVESYANCTPVVAPKITGVEDIVLDGHTGFLHLNGDVEGMAASVLRLVEDPTLAEKMGCEGETLVRERFACDRLTQEWIELLTTAIRALPPQIVPIRRRTWKRWKHIASSEFTLLRSLEYEAIEGLNLKGKTLDIGGGAKNSYYHLFKFQGSVDSVNIDINIQPTILADLNQPLPLPSETYDNAISLNTFEHIYNDRIAIEEALRVLKSGGEFHFIVPFLYQVHASPCDYHRRTAYWWIDFLKSLGINESQFHIEPLVWDRISSAYSFVDDGSLGLRLKSLVTLLAVIKDLRWKGKERLPIAAFSKDINVTLGYYIYGVK